MSTELATNRVLDSREERLPEPPPPQPWDLYPAGAVEETDRPATILLLERKEINRHLLRATLESEGYRILEATRATDAFELLEAEQVDLIILGLMLPEIGGLDFCRRIKSRRQTRLVPILILTSVGGAENEIAGIASGADEFLVKPLNPAIVRTRIRAMLRHKAAIDSLEEAESILFALAQAIEQRDKCTGGHCERLAITSMMLGSALGLPRSQLLALHRGGFLHDIGKVAIPDSILFKNGSLSEEEWEIMRTHTIRGEEICRPIRTLSAVLPIIRSHHERWDGSGYPDGLGGEAIPLLARILQVADVFDALTSVRPYKPALSSSEALNVLDAEARRGWREPRLVALLHQLFEAPLDDSARQLLAGWPLSDSVPQSLENMRRALLK
ncbi:MAG: HD domain-containing phosphohydrolase [Bryobacteraceae bacterium]